VIVASPSALGTLAVKPQRGNGDAVIAFQSQPLIRPLLERFQRRTDGLRPGCLAAAFLPAPAAAAAAVAPRGVPAGRRPVTLVAGDEHVPRPERLRPVVLRGGGSDGSEQRIQDQL